MTIAKPQSTIPLPDHTQLPESDGTFVKNFQEHPQSLLLTTSITPILNTLHPDGHYAIGQDSGIYWRLTQPLEKGAEAPDWFYVPNVPPLLDGVLRRSYVLWKEQVIPLIAIEFVSGDGKEERDTTNPSTNRDAKAGKFWVYEQAIKIPFYAIYEAEKAAVEVYELVNQRYQKCAPNQRGHYPIPPLGVELGLWLGAYQNVTLPWLRWWDLNGRLLPSAEERADQATHMATQEKQRADQATLEVEAERQKAEAERQKAEAERQRAEAERQRANRLAAKLLELGIDASDLV